MDEVRSTRTTIMQWFIHSFIDACSTLQLSPDTPNHQMKPLRCSTFPLIWHQMSELDWLENDPLYGKFIASVGQSKRQKATLFLFHTSSVVIHDNELSRSTLAVHCSRSTNIKRRKGNDHITLDNHSSSLLPSMALNTSFDDLPDLVVIEVFSYLSSIDVLWAFINLNHCIQDILDERGLFRHINWSAARRSKFEILLSLVPLDQIQSLIIDVDASPLQLSHWPDLPRLTTLRLHGVRDFQDAASFILRHSHSLQRLTLETNDQFMSVSIVDRQRGNDWSQ